MSANKYLVSVVIPVFNRKNLLLETIQSLKNQSYSNWEAILVDDGSTDGTYESILELAESDPRLKLHQRKIEPKGASSCRNYGIGLSKGEFLFFLDSDDILAHHCLNERVHHFCQNPEMDFLIFPALIFEEKPGDTNILWNIDKDRDDIVRFLNIDVPWQTSASFFRRKILNEIGSWDNTTSAWEDMDYHVRALIKGLKYKKINTQPDYYYRIYNKDKLSNNDNTVEQLYARIRLAEKFYQYFKENDKFTPLYRKKLFNFYLWICYSFYRAEHFPGVKAVCYSLYKKGPLNILSYAFLKNIMIFHYFVIYNSYKKKPLQYIRKKIREIIFEMYFKKIPPIDCTTHTERFFSKPLEKVIVNDHN
ncbi:hypothetical protein BH23BAC1_BH23BAC1_15560 [soil metagenome]